MSFYFYLSTFWLKYFTSRHWKRTRCRVKKIKHEEKQSMLKKILKKKKIPPLIISEELVVHESEKPPLRLFYADVTGFKTPTSMFTLVVLIVTIVVCLSHVCFGHFKYLSAHNYKVKTVACKVQKVTRRRPISRLSLYLSHRLIPRTPTWTR